MYEQYFELTRRPFASLPDVASLFWTPGRRGISEHLACTPFAEVPLALLVGDEGTGKTTLLRHLAATSAPEVTAGMISGRDGGDIRDRVRDAFPWKGQAGATVEETIAAGLASEREAGRRAVLIVDDADALGDDEMSALLRLGLPAPGVRLPMVLAGAPDAFERLREERVRVGDTLSTEPFTAPQTARYVRHKVRAAGGGGLFTDEALEEVHRLTWGNPVRIDALADRLLATAMRRGMCRVELDLVGVVWNAGEEDATTPAATPAAASAPTIPDAVAADSEAKALYSALGAAGMGGGVSPDYAGAAEVLASSFLPDRAEVQSALAAIIEPDDPADGKDDETRKTARTEKKKTKAPALRLPNSPKQKPITLTRAERTERTSPVPDKAKRTVEPEPTETPLTLRSPVVPEPEPRAAKPSLRKDPPRKPAKAPPASVTPPVAPPDDGPVLRPKPKTPMTLRAPAAPKREKPGAPIQPPVSRRGSQSDRRLPVVAVPLEPAEPPRPRQRSFRLAVPSLPQVARTPGRVGRARRFATGAGLVAVSALAIAVFLQSGDHLSRSNPPTTPRTAMLAQPDPAGSLNPVFSGIRAPGEAAVRRIAPREAQSGPALDSVALFLRPRLQGAHPPPPRPLRLDEDDLLRLSGLTIGLPRRVALPGSAEVEGALAPPPEPAPRPPLVAGPPTEEAPGIAALDRAGSDTAPTIGAPDASPEAEPPLSISADGSREAEEDDLQVSMTSDVFEEGEALLPPGPPAPELSLLPRVRPAISAPAQPLGERSEAPLTDPRAESLAKLAAIESPAWDETATDAAGVAPDGLAPPEPAEDAVETAALPSHELEIGAPPRHTLGEPSWDDAMWTAMPDRQRVITPSPEPYPGSRIIVHYHPRNAQRALSLVAPLVARGFDTEMREIPFGVSDTNIRYYFDEDLKSARQLSGVVASIGREGSPVTRDFSHMETLPRRGTIELWLGD